VTLAQILHVQQARTGVEDGVVHVEVSDDVTHGADCNMKLRGLMTDELRYCTRFRPIGIVGVSFGPGLGYIREGGNGYETSSDYGSGRADASRQRR